MNSTKKTYLVTVVLLALLVAGVLFLRQGRVAENFALDYGDHAPYTQAEIDAAAAEIQSNFKKAHHGSVLNKLEYRSSGDQTMHFAGSYTIKKTLLSQQSGHRLDEDYTCGGWGWTVAQNDAGHWKVVSEGYG